MLIMEKRKITIIGGVILILLLSVVLVGRSRQAGTVTEEVSPSPTSEIIPTIDDSVKVDLTSVKGGKEVMLSIESIPAGTTLIDYELSYETRQQGLQGLIGSIPVEDGEEKKEKTVTLGTCSSGTCTYHQVEGSVKVALRFEGKYGVKIFEKEFEL